MSQMPEHVPQGPARLPKVPSLAGLFQGVPGLVMVAAGLAAMIAAVLAVFVSMLTAIAVDAPVASSSFAGTLAALTGQQFGFSGRFNLGFGNGTGEFTVRMIPFGLITLSAYLLTQLGFTRAWLSVDRGRWVPPIAGILVTAGVVAVALISAAFAGIDVGLAALDLRVQPSLLGLLLLGAGPWLLARWAVRSAFVRNLLWGVLTLQVLTVAALLIPVLAAVADDRSAGAFEGLVAFLSVLTFGIAYGANLVILVLWLPFLGAVGVGGTLGTLVGLTGESTNAGFLELASESPWMWLAPPIALAGLVLAAWLQPAATNRTDLYRQLSQSAGALLAFSLPVLWAGRIMVRAAGDLAGDVNDELALFLGGQRGISGALDAQLDVTLGAVGMPFRLVPALALWTVIVGVVMFLAAQANGATWADPAAFAQDTRATGGRFLDRVRAATQAAQAAATSEGQAGPPAGQAGAPAEWVQQPPMGQPQQPAPWAQQPPMEGPPTPPAPDPVQGWAPPAHPAPPQPSGDQTQPIDQAPPAPPQDDHRPIEGLDTLPPPTIQHRRPD